MKIKSYVILFIISYLVLVAGLIVIIFGIYSSSTALSISGLSLIGSFVGMYASAFNTKKQHDKDRPYLILRTNEERYGMLQLEIYNAGNNGAIVREVLLNDELDIISGGTLKENLENCVIQAKGSVAFPYIVYGNKKFDSYYKNISGELKYKDFSNDNFTNRVNLNLLNLRNQLAHQTEAIKRDYEIIKTCQHLRKNIKND
ncbi:hypothetical protein SAMN05421743_105204 [Thalassobacillus cyri]|uniref:Uncharacterized protein n=1 Tax=Thalassobacillus cyri TaxID=571932 RepID=A0A1H4BZD2_9BACI|nr:hypothetical protein [Thalassobacillus cyri]SEA53420.1 hypothetical protein SAMN05421743_105204 [Thalassobacillus cyri]